MNTIFIMRIIKALQVSTYSRNNKDLKFKFKCHPNFTPFSVLKRWSDFLVLFPHQNRDKVQPWEAPAWMTDLEMEIFRQANSPVAVRLGICEREAGGRGWSWSDERKGLAPIPTQSGSRRTATWRHIYIPSRSITGNHWPRSSI